MPTRHPPLHIRGSGAFRAGRRMLAALFGTGLSALLLAAGAAQAAPVSEIKISVPKRSPAHGEIRALKITLQLNDASQIAIRVQGPNAGGGNMTSNPMTLTNATDDCFPDGGGTSCFSDTWSAPSTDSVTVIKPQHAGADPASAGNDKMVILLRLNSNTDSGATCPSLMAGNEEWTITTLTPALAASARIEAVAVQSLDNNVGGICNNSKLRPIPANEGASASISAPANVLASGRIGLDAVLVLDRSGSMWAQDGTATSRLDKLKDATGRFLDMWKVLRDTESSPAGNIQSPDDRIGIVYFDHATNWVTNLPGGGLTPFTGPAVPGLKLAVNGQSLGGATSIGKGLTTAVGAGGLPAPGGATRRLVLLMTDGAQNTAKFAFASGNEIRVSDDAGNVVNPTPLANQPFQLYSVTVGNEFGPDAPINQQLAAATGGYSLNTTEPAAELDTFFLQALQNFHKFSTVETLRIVQDGTAFNAPFETRVPVSSGIHRLAFSLGWNPRLGRLRLELTPPSGGTPLLFDVPPPTTTAGVPSGSIVAGFPLPLPDGRASEGEWRVRVLTAGDDSKRIPFHFVLLGDDATLNSSLAIAPGVHAVGGKLRLTAQINDFGRTLKGLDGQPQATVKAILVAPGENVGDVLSDASVQPAQSPPGDTATQAQNKMTALLVQDPQALARAAREVTLRDDGQAASGDEKAGDGVYSGLYPADFEGHYNVVFVVEGESESGGRFVRQQIRTAYVRSLPDPGNTVYQVTPLDNALRIVATPRNVRGGKLGPGWANYLWFLPVGGPPVKGVDNLDGTYTATVPFVGGQQPTVSVHFIDDPIYLPDGYVPPAGTLGADTQVTADVINGDGKPWWERLLKWLQSLPWWWWIVALFVLLLLWLLLRRKK